MGDNDIKMLFFRNPFHLKGIAPVKDPSAIAYNKKFSVNCQLRILAVKGQNRKLDKEVTWCTCQEELDSVVLCWTSKVETWVVLLLELARACGLAQSMFWERAVKVSWLASLTTWMISKYCWKYTIELKWVCFNKYISEVFSWFDLSLNL